jgi:hypothetical protein
VILLRDGIETSLVRRHETVPVEMPFSVSM